MNFITFDNGEVEALPNSFVATREVLMEKSPAAVLLQRKSTAPVHPLQPETKKLKH